VLGRRRARTDSYHPGYVLFRIRNLYFGEPVFYELR
jgi:hypothetical protein